MTITCAYKGKVETDVLLTKNEYWINSNHFHKLSNILMKLERITERKYSMPATTTKRKFRFTRGFMLVLELKGFYSGAKKIMDIFKCPQCYFQIINFCKVIQSCKPIDTN